MSETLRVEVAYARADRQFVIAVELDLDATLADAVAASGILERCPEIDLEKSRVGVFGKLATLDRPLRNGDRVEIYRPLIGDPKEIRRRLAAEGKTMGRN
ncbi:MAG: RnfH family protein [Gammaproteobacteria bacterium]